MRQIVLDTETTGLEPRLGHRIIEIGCVELVDRRLTGRHFHQYLNPERDIDEGAIEVHGLTPDFLADKPLFSAIVDDFIDFVSGAELVIHNAPFDMGFLNHELKLHDGKIGTLDERCKVLDTLVMARKKHPGQKNSLDALCKRYYVDNSQRDLHGALLDAEILADVYLAMTGGQTDLALAQSNDNEEQSNASNEGEVIRRLSASRAALKVIRASDDELVLHNIKLDKLVASTGNESVAKAWKTSE